MAPAHEHSHDAAELSDDLRAKGRRMTRQRTLIWQTFTEDSEQHLSAEDVVERVHRQLPQVNPSTVYRTLELLVEEGLLLRTDLGEGRAFYEPAREHAHHHLVCEDCGAVSHFHDEVLGDLSRRIRTSTGYVLGAGELTLFGLCADCASRLSKAPLR
jgi:Fur family transcriptional regulator, ferric uptake regulator